MNQARLMELFEYSPNGDNARPLVRIVTTGSRSKKGDRPGSICRKRGYVTLGVDGKTRYMHRVVYCLLHGDDFDEIDHKDRDKANNLDGNLRDCSHEDNSKNMPIRSSNTSGCPGVNWSKKDKVWHVRIRANGKRLFLGGFKDFNKAVEVRNQALEELHGDFSGETLN